MGEAAQDLTGTVLAGRYRIVRPLGSGGMGAVYEARQEDLGRRVAVKVLHRHLADDASLVTRFRREAEAAARLGHPNIVQVTDFGRSEEGHVFLVMDYLEGASLGAVIEREGRLEPRRAARIGCQMLSALEAAHAAGLVHRDLKPDNVFLTSVSGVGEVVKLLDFGIAKLVEGEGAGLTATGAVLGTPAYMAPEQARGAAIDARVDLYAVGVVLYEALSGRLPYGGANYNAMIAAILTEDPPSLSSLRPDLPPELSAAVERAMARDASTRFSTAAQMRGALLPFAEVEAGAALSSHSSHGNLATDPTVASDPQAEARPARQTGAGGGVRAAVWVPLLILATAGVAGGLVYGLVGTDGEPQQTAAPAGAPPSAASASDSVDVEPLPDPEVVEPEQPERPTEEATDDEGDPVEEEPVAANRRVRARPTKRRGPPPPRFRVVYTGGMTHNRYTVDELRAAVGRISDRMTRCYRGRDEIGNTTWAVDIDEAGRASNPRVPGNIHDAEPVLACMREAATHLDFGEPPEGGPGELRFWVRADPL